MAVEFKQIPVLDVSLDNFNPDEDDIEQVDKKLLFPIAERLCQVLQTVGFVYLKNHGIPEHKIDKMTQTSADFKSTKMKYAKTVADDDNGWVQIGNENFSDIRPGDYKEAYDITEYEHMGKIPSEEDAPSFHPTMMDMFTSCMRLGHRVMYLIGLGLNPQDPSIFIKEHSTLKIPSATALRTLYYPPIKDPSILKPNQIGCGEHTDFGTLTFVFQNDVGGLEVLNKSGEFIPASPIPGTVVMNVADTLQRWKADRLVSTVHRVMPNTRNTKARQSFAFFLHPDNDFTISCYDGSNKYEPINAEEFTRMRYRTSFK